MMLWLPFQKLPDNHAADGTPASMAQMLAKGKPEAQRIMQQHQRIKRELHGNFMAPLPEPHVVLDVGCNNGRWAMEVAVQFPAARVVGIDPILPAPFLHLGNGIAQKPANVELLQGNIAGKLPFPDATFDLVHARFIYTMLSANAWEPLLHEMIRVTQVGGWIEMLEPLPYAAQQKDGMATIINWFSDWLRQRGCDPLAALKIATMMKAAGLDHVSTCQIGQISSQDQDADELALQRKNCLLFIDLVRDPLVTDGIVSRADYDRTAATAQAEVQRNTLLNGFKTYINYAQRKV
jgi:ubiquinone/menaquinone biosynthesis C-methylase UbiE